MTIDTFILTAAETLGAAIFTDDWSEFRELLANADHGDVVACLCSLDLPNVKAAVHAGYDWAPGGRMWQAAAPLRASLDADARKNRLARQTDPRRSGLIREAFRLLDHGVGARELLVSLHQANAALRDPLPVAVVDTLAIWAAERFLGRRHAA